MGGAKIARYPPRMRPAHLTSDALTCLNGSTIARVSAQNPLALDPTAAAGALPAHESVLGWSGGLGDELFERSFRTWMPAGRAALDAYLDAAEAVLDERGSRLLLRTHARHVISDAQAALGLLAARVGAPIGIALDPASCLEASMLRDLEDHLTRFLTLAGKAADVIVLGSLERPASLESEELLKPAPLGEGIIDAKLLGALVREHAREDAVVAVVGEGPEGQLRRAELL